MPFVGYLIVFNTTLSDYFSTILPAALGNETADFWTFLYSRNLYFLYFGLLFFGSGVALFNVAAPPQIRRFPVVESYISAMGTIKTPSLVIVSFEKVIEMYFDNLHGEERSPLFSSTRIGFPYDVNADLHRFVESLYLAIDLSQEDSELAGSLFEESFRSGSGYILTDEILETAYSGNRVVKILQKQLLDESVAHPNDVFYLEHRALDYTQGLTRIAVFLFYATGSVLLVLPSIVTSIVILKLW
ncbi:MAG: hypothetical protein ABJG04_07640 [Roseobacter sp.]